MPSSLAFVAGVLLPGDRGFQTAQEKVSGMVFSRLLHFFSQNDSDLVLLNELARGCREPSAQVDVQQRVVRSKLGDIPFEQLQKLWLLTLPPGCGPFPKVHVVAVKVFRGPIYGWLREFKDPVQASRFAQKLALRLGLNTAESGYAELLLADARRVLNRTRSLHASTDLGAVSFLQGGCLLPLMVGLFDDTSIDAWGDLWIGAEGLLLLNGMGESQKVADFHQLQSAEMQEETVCQGDQEVLQIRLTLHLKQAPPLRLQATCGAIRAESTGSEMEEAQQQRQQARRAARTFLKSSWSSP